MHDSFDEDLEPRLRNYLSSQLDRQAGKAAASFAKLPVEAPVVPAKHSSPVRLGRLAAVLAVLAASVVVAVWGGLRLIHWPAARNDVAESKPGELPPKASDKRGRVENPSYKPPEDRLAPEAIAKTPATEPTLVGQHFQWRTIDEGIVYLDEHTPVRKLRRQRLERIEWYDAAHGAVVQMVVPREEVQFVALPSS